jgi:hypothetical protein
MRKLFFALKQKDIFVNVAIYGVFLIIAFLGILYGEAIKNEYNFLRVWDFNNLLLMCIGIPFLFLMNTGSLPNFWEKRISLEDKFFKPILIGLTFGALDIFVWKLMVHPEPYSELPPFLQPFPYSTFLFFSGAFEIEVFYRLIPLTILLSLGNWVAKGKYYNYFFYIAVFLTSIREPLEQLPNEGFLLVAYSLISGFLMNALQAIYFKKAGFIASLFIRLGHYLFWHILLGIYVQFIEC